MQQPLDQLVIDENWRLLVDLCLFLLRDSPLTLEERVQFAVALATTSRTGHIVSSVVIQELEILLLRLGQD